MIINFPQSEPNFGETFNVKLEANRPYVLETYGRVFVCLLAGASFKCSFNNGKYFDMFQGARWSLQPDERYTLLKFLSPIDQEITVITGHLDYDPPRTITTAPTRGIPGPSSIDGMTTVDLITTPPGMSYRKAVVITNNDNAVDLDVLTQDETGNWQLAGTVFSRQAWYLETSDAVRIFNPSEGVVNMRVLELFYLSQ